LSLLAALLSGRKMSTFNILMAASFYGNSHSLLGSWYGRSETRTGHFSWGRSPTASADFQTVAQNLTDW